MTHQSKRDYLKTALWLLVLVGAVAVLGALRDFRHDFEDSRNDSRCILRELADHRQNNYEADIRQAEAVGAKINDLPPPPSLPDGGEWDKACEGILGVHDHER